MAASDWIAFWDSKHSIYVNRRHEVAHFHRIAEDIRGYAPAGGTMLDYGCGEALSADLVAQAAGHLILCEPAPQVRAALTARFSGNGRIAVRTPDEVAAMPAQSVDTIVMHSVSQYLDDAEFERVLTLFRRLLKPDGLVVVGDVIPRRLGAFDDAVELLRFALHSGFLFAAVAGLARTYFSDYWRLRQSLGVARYDAGEIEAKFRAAGFTMERARTNIGHNSKRMTFLARVR